MLFNNSKYISCNDILNPIKFEWPNNSNPKASISFSVQNNQAVSLPKSPYAGFELSEDITALELSTLTQELKQWALKKSITSISVKQAPDVFHLKSDFLNNALTSAGFKSSEEINHHVMLKNWRSGFSKMQLRKVAKCEKQRLTFQENDKSSPNQIYDFLAKCRAQQNLKVNVSEIQFQKLLDQFKNEFKVYTVSNYNQQLMACLVNIQVSKEIIYSFLPAFDRQFSSFSPLSFLFHELFDYLSKSDTKIMDLGISSINGHPQEGLIQFKESIGGILTQRKTYTLSV